MKTLVYSLGAVLVVLFTHPAHIEAIVSRDSSFAQSFSSRTRHWPRHVETMQEVFLSQPCFEKVDTLLLLTHSSVFNRSVVHFYSYNPNNHEVIGLQYETKKLKTVHRKLFEGKKQHRQRLWKLFEPIQYSSYFEPIKNLAQYYNQGNLYAFRTDEHWKNKNPFMDSFPYYRYGIYVRKKGQLRQVEEAEVGYWYPEDALIFDRQFNDKKE